MVEHEAANNYQAGPDVSSHYENRLTCRRSDIRWRPDSNFNSEPCINPGVHTATVVGPAASEIHTDGFGRVKIQFHWDRLGKYDEKSSPWIRVMVPAAGRHFGQMRLPRVAEEVVVVYQHGNIDRPLILGALSNAIHMPQWALPNQAALSGLRSRELGGSGTRGNHLILDDTNTKIQAQLKSDHDCSQLSLGYITRIEDQAGRKDARGEGWELRTDGYGVARAAKGMLITTEARPAARGPIKDMSETTHRLTSAGNQHQVLAEIALRNGAQEGCDRQIDVAELLRGQNKEIQGASGSDEFPELTMPHVILASSAGIALTSATDTHVSSGRNTALTAEKSISLAAGDSLFASVSKALRLFVQKAGMKMIAASGDIDIQALSNSINFLAKLDITQSANKITINAKEEIVINGGGSYVKFSAGSIEIGTSGFFTGHATTYQWLGAKKLNSNASANELIAVLATEILQSQKSWVEIKLVDQEGPIPRQRYVLTDPSGVKHTGCVDEQGNARIDQLTAGRCNVEFPDLDHSIEVTAM